MKTLTSFVIGLSLLVTPNFLPISSKTIESKMVKIEEDFFINKFETTNQEYNAFLTWAKKANASEILSESKIHHDGWSGIMKDAYSKLYASNEGYQEYPVVNITQEGARNFCDWLTDQYNTSKKRKYKKVKFRLPTKLEWVNIASRKRDIVAYPWGSPYLRNKKGDYLANFFRVGESRMKVKIDDRKSVEVNNIEDRLSFAVPGKVESYPQGLYGIYNLSGNAAEMVEEKGATKGGSWGSSGYYLRIDAEDEFAGFDYSPYIGFRYVMEVIEK